MCSVLFGLLRISPLALAAWLALRSAPAISMAEVAEDSRVARVVHMIASQTLSSSSRSFLRAARFCSWASLPKLDWRCVDNVFAKQQRAGQKINKLILHLVGHHDVHLHAVAALPVPVLKAGGPQVPTATLVQGDDSVEYASIESETRTAIESGPSWSVDDPVARHQPRLKRSVRLLKSFGQHEPL